MIVRVKWVDSCVQHDWQRPCKSSGGLSKCESVGYIVRKNKGEITLAQSKSDTGNITELNCMIFPGRGRKCASALNVASPVSAEKNTALAV